MIQDKGIKMVVIKTGKLVETTGQMLLVEKGVWKLEVIYRHGVKHWYNENELQVYFS